MGQTIEVEAETVGDVAVFDTDRSITGQDGDSFESLQSALESAGPAADLATRLFRLDEAVSHVFVASNTATVRRDGGWDEGSLAAGAAVIRELFVFYGEPRADATS
jgi:hypothetical protein